MASLTLLSPLSGWCTSLEETPDEAFAQRLLGEGVAIDPTAGSLLAPCDAQVISVAAARHAVALRAAQGVELLLHVGIDTVTLRGEGFEVFVQAGARVRAGERLMSFDLEVLARSARSLITPVLVTNAGQFSLTRLRCHRVVQAGDALMEITPASATAQRALEAAGPAVSEPVMLRHEHGLHARPATAVANLAKNLGAQLTVTVRGRSARADSAVALMALGAQEGDELTLTGRGENAAGAVRELKQLIEGLARTASVAGEPASRAEERSAAGGAGRLAPAESAPAMGAMVAPRPVADARLNGVIASRGFAVGRAVRLDTEQLQVREEGTGLGYESAELERARARVRERLREQERQAHPLARELIAAHLAFLDDPALVTAARQALAGGKSAGFAWRTAVRAFADQLRALGDTRLGERVDDLIDLEGQVLEVLRGETPAPTPPLPADAILVAQDLRPSQLLALEATPPAGIALAAGGPTSHVAILAAALDVPALVALGPGVLEIAGDTELILDAEQGHLIPAPEPAALADAQRALAQRREHQRAEQAAAQARCHTADGVRIEVFANLASRAEAEVAVAHGAEGCGLLRTEFLFLDRATPPTEAEQTSHYQALADALAGRPLIVRTLDAGGDKPIAYLPLPAEENPALGLRGVRASLWRPDLLRAQLRAVLGVRPPGRCRVLLPMITDVAEIGAVRGLLEEVRAEFPHAAELTLGVMIETPAAALLADAMAKTADFLSIGTNDLTQYTLAMDRGHAELAHRLDGLHPAVLQLIAGVTQAAERHGRTVAVCGGLAAEPTAVPVLIGLGVRELSVALRRVPQTKALIRHLSLAACRDLARRALAQESAEAVRALAQEFSTTQPARVLP